MENTTAAVDRYLAAWNEGDTARRRALLADSLVENVSFVDPLLESTGYDPIEALIGQLQTMLPGGRLQRLGEIEAHHNVVRFTWEAGIDGEEAVVVGTDIAVIGEDGRMKSIIAFFDRVPAGLLS